MHAFCIFAFAPVQRNWACFTWKGALEIRSLLLLLTLPVFQYNCMSIYTKTAAWLSLQTVRVFIHDHLDGQEEKSLPWKAETWWLFPVESYQWFKHWYYSGCPSGSQHPAPHAKPWPGTCRGRRREAGLTTVGGETLKQSWNSRGPTGPEWQEQPRTECDGGGSLMAYAPLGAMGISK